MTRLRLFTAFHANLDFSAIPDADRPSVLAACYWPLLELPERWAIPIGFEMNARTLETLAREDPEWLKRFAGLVERGLVEPIVSGWAQVVAPLVPVEINRENLSRGLAAFRERLGIVPDTFFVNEQTWSDGLAPLYREAGAARLVMEWNNPASRRPELRPLRCQPARLVTRSGPGPIVLWNDSVVFQKVQRVAHGEIPHAELDRLLSRLVGIDARHAEREAGALDFPDVGPVGADPALCLYGGDVEIFDYRPSRQLPAPRDGRRELDRLIDLFRRLAEDSRFEFVLPRDVVQSDEPLPSVRLGSAEDPIPCKKQPRYNPTRWAVSGRDGFGMNTRCQALLRTERSIASLDRSSGGLDADAAERLVELWRSDFRTRATQEKIAEFEAQLGVAREAAGLRLAASTPELAEGEDLLLVNPHAEAWTGMPVEIPIRLPAGRFEDATCHTPDGRPVAASDAQLEVSSRHRDGSVREAIVVLIPHLAPRERLGLRLVPRARTSETSVSHGESRGAATARVELAWLPHRGGAIESLVFPGLGPARPLLGTIPHGSFDAIAYTPDFYSGHVVALTEGGRKLTDLEHVEIAPVDEASGGVRVTYDAAVETALGPWRKRFRLYRDRPRLDLVHDLGFHDARLASLRLGLVSLLPDSWDRDRLRFGTVNGGRDQEWWRLPAGASIEQSRAVSHAVSATSCLGASEGWVAFEDDRQGLIVTADLAEAATVPMIDFAEVDDAFFLRLSHSAAEQDETRASFLRGRQRFSFSLEGYVPGDTGAISRARLAQRGLVYRTESSLGISSGL